LSIDPLVSESLAALSKFFVGDHTVQQTLQRVADLTVTAVPPADFAGLTLLVEGRERTAVFTDPASPEIDQAQYDTGDGPCLQAFQQGEIVSVPSMADDARFPAFQAAALEHGINSTLSLPLAVDDVVSGAMNLYSKTEHGFSDADVRVGQEFASHSAIVLANALAYWDAHDLSERLGDAMASRAVIEQAKGILMGAQRCGEDEAFALLVAASQRENVKLRDIAHRIVVNATGGGNQDDGLPRPADGEPT
jgi:GAF domain-containing protein